LEIIFIKISTCIYNIQKLVNIVTLVHVLI